MLKSMLVKEEQLRRVKTNGAKVLQGRSRVNTADRVNALTPASLLRDSPQGARICNRRFVPRRVLFSASRSRVTPSHYMLWKDSSMSTGPTSTVKGQTGEEGAPASQPMTSS